MIDFFNVFFCISYTQSNKYFQIIFIKKSILLRALCILVIMRHTFNKCT